MGQQQTVQAAPLAKRCVTIEDHGAPTRPPSMPAERLRVSDYSSMNRN